jgi:hypothetical protein
MSRTWESIVTGLEEMCCVAVNVVELTQNRVQWQAVLFVMSSLGAVLRTLWLVI